VAGFLPPSSPQNGQIIGLGSAGRENDLKSIASDHERNGLPGLLERLGDSLRERVLLTGQIKVVPKVRLHRFQHRGCDRGLTIEIEIDGGHVGTSLWPNRTGKIQDNLDSSANMTTDLQPKRLLSA